jgi:Protein of unknown function (DUF1592)/Protein of unknown function (DUF1588)/Protein of unknown function (DUF1595)/Protein of unknown function (DUF1587)/Protein of unknown function (DUF1585)
MRPSARNLAGCLLAFVLSAGCTGLIKGNQGELASGSASTAATGQDSTAGGGMTANGSAGGSAVSSGGPNAPAAAAPLVRLTSVQYENTLRALFAPVVVPDEVPPPDVAVDGFENNSTTQTPSAALISAYQSSAIAVATAAMQDSTALLGCTPTTPDEESTCAQRFLATFGKKAFRRTLSESEQASMLAFYQSQRTGGVSFATAMTLTIEGILQSPNFLYRVEIGTPIADRPTAVRLNSSEVASRLSYLLLDSMPDDELFAAADADTLTTPDGVEAQTRRLLADTRAHDAVARFHRGWLEFDKMQNLAKDTQAFPTWTAATWTALQQSAEMYVDNIFFGEGTLSALLTDSHAYVNDVLAPIYGVPSPGPDLQLVPVDPAQRSGILTNAGLLAGFAHQTTDSPVFRGVFVLSRLMCSAPPPPPKGVNTSLPAMSSGAPLTTRQEFATQHEQGGCAGCHHMIDGIGFGFEQYDAVGQFRTTDNGLPVDASGWFTDGSSGDLTGTFDGAVELGKKLAASKTVQACVATQWMRQALGVDTTGIGQDQLEPVVDAFVASGLSMPELVVALTRSDAFLTRVVAP